MHIFPQLSIHALRPTCFYVFVLLGKVKDEISVLYASTIIWRQLGVEVYSYAVLNLEVQVLVFHFRPQNLYPWG